MMRPFLPPIDASVALGAAARLRNVVPLASFSRHAPLAQLAEQLTLKGSSELPPISF